MALVSSCIITEGQLAVFIFCCRKCLCEVSRLTQSLAPYSVVTYEFDLAPKDRLQEVPKRQFILMNFRRTIQFSSPRLFLENKAGVTWSYGLKRQLSVLRRLVKWVECWLFRPAARFPSDQRATPDGRATKQQLDKLNKYFRTSFRFTTTVCACATLLVILHSIYVCRKHCIEP